MYIHVKPNLHHDTLVKENLIYLIYSSLTISSKHISGNYN